MPVVVDLPDKARVRGTVSFTDNVYSLSGKHKFVDDQGNTHSITDNMITTVDLSQDEEPSELPAPKYGVIENVEDMEFQSTYLDVREDGDDHVEAVVEHATSPNRLESILDALDITGKDLPLVYYSIMNSKNRNDTETEAYEYFKTFNSPEELMIAAVHGAPAAASPAEKPKEKVIALVPSSSAAPADAKAASVPKVETASAEVAKNNTFAAPAVAAEAASAPKAETASAEGAEDSIIEDIFGGGNSDY